MKSQPYYEAIPINNRKLAPEDRQRCLEEIRQTKVQRVWIFIGGVFLRESERTKELKHLRENLQFFEENGIEAGVWIQGFGYGTPLGEKELEIASGWTRIRSVTGGTCDSAFCPESEAFAEEFYTLLDEVAQLLPRLIMIDDDMCLSVRPGLGCFCDKHLELLSKEMGEKIELDGLAERMFTGGENPLRTAWLKVMRKTMVDFCAKARSVVDAVDNTIRMGFCAGYTSWDIEGADAIELSHVLAGKTRPFLRFTGAPYWVTQNLHRFLGQKLNTVIEIARVQQMWCQDTDIEIFNENDNWPRATYHCPVSYVECFDIAMRAHGNMGTLKYIFPYHCAEQKEWNYLKKHKKNMPFYDWIASNFDDKKVGGVRVYHEMRTIETANLPLDLNGQMLNELDVMQRVFSSASSFLTQMGIPVCYEDHGTSPECAIAFGEDVKYIPENVFPKKLILDLPAAKLLQKNGIDVGLLSSEQVGWQGQEIYTLPGEERERVGLTYSAMGRAPYLGTAFAYCKVKDNAEVQSWYLDTEGNDVPASYIYHNGDTTFLVLLVDGYIVGQSSSSFSAYARQRQLLQFVGGLFPYIAGTNNMYTLYKESDDHKSVAVLFENLSEDGVEDFDIVLNRDCENFELFGATGELSQDGRVIHVTSELSPWGYLGLKIDFQ